MRPLLFFAAALFTLPLYAASPAPNHCTSLATFQLPGHMLHTLDLHAVSEGPLTLNGRTLQLPAHCLWKAELDPRTGVDGKPYAIGFELRLPANWNGKFFFQGGGGMDGLIRPAIGAMPNGTSTAPVALARGYAVASTDAGHEGQDGSFGIDQQARIDYTYNAVEQVTALVRQLLPAFYGSPLQHAYFVGCSNGGRQALLAAQRLPLSFDGVVAGDPAFNLTRAAIAEFWDDRAFLSIAPHDTSGQPILSQSFSDADLHLLRDSILEHCDALDGLRDGSIENPKACHYDPAVLTCKAGQSTGNCLSPQQVDALHRAFAGPKDSSGKELYSSWPYDGGIGTPGWRFWKLGTSSTSTSNALNMTLGLDAMRSIHQDTYQPTLSLATFDFDTAVSRSRNASATEDATATLLDSFSNHGGKLILFTGMSDPIFSATDLIDYYGRLQTDNPNAENFARLFLIPGMNHCSGGPALDDFDTLSALESWVESGHAPDVIPAHGKAFPDRTRSLCAYPAYPHYNGSGSPDASASFTCRAP